MELDHVFVFVDAADAAPGGALRGRLDALGLVPTYSRRHHGQGTANLAYVFDNAYLELLFVVDPVELASPAVARTGLSARARWRETGASPVGIGLRRSGEAPPFATWDYRFDALPPGMTIPVALDSADVRQPFLFVSPGSGRPDAWTDGRAGARQAAAGFTEIARVAISMPDGVAPSPALRAVATSGIVRLRSSERHGLAVDLRRNDGAVVTLSLPDGNVA